MIEVQDKTNKKRGAAATPDTRKPEKAGNAKMFHRLSRAFQKRSFKAIQGSIHYLSREGNIELHKGENIQVIFPFKKDLIAIKAENNGNRICDWFFTFCLRKRNCLKTNE
jgi:hypothetical protein